MKSGKQRRAELDARKAARSAKAKAESDAKSEAAARLEYERAMATGVPVNRELLKSHNSYGEPEFVERGFYADQPFDCVDCGASEVWTATQQKWWYEVAKGDAFTTARRCRGCRRKERERKANARKVHQKGLVAKGYRLTLPP